MTKRGCVPGAMTMIESSFGVGEIAARLAQRDWRSHALGDASTWPPSLRSAIVMCLASHAPMQVWWGRTLALFYNDAAIPLVDTHPDALGTPVGELSGERWRTLREPAERVFADSRPVATNDWLLVPIFESDGSVAGIACTQLGAESAYRVVHQRAVDEVLALVGHELRNPLSSVTTMLQALLLRAPSRELELMSRAVSHLTRLVEDLHESSRLSRGKIVLQRKPVELAQVLDRALELAAMVLEGNSSEVTLDVPRGGCCVDVDPERLARAFANLLASAALHGPPGTPIAIALLRDGDQVRLCVRDGGAATRTRSAGIFGGAPQHPVGVGLGLEIARSIIELHGGTLAHEAIDGGTTCVITLAGSAQPATQLARPTVTARKRLLVVEDNNDTAHALKLALEQLGYEVVLAHDAPVAINIAKSLRPDVALLDLGLPVVDGWELARRLRGADIDIPIVAVTARDQETDRQRSAELGFAGHLVKPIDVARLAQVVDSLPSAIKA